MKNGIYSIDVEKVKADLAASSYGKEATVLQYDAMKAISALQGIVNRKSPRIFLLTEEHDSFWLDYVSEEGKLLASHARTKLSSFSEIVSVFREEMQSCGLVLWDPKVPATSNVAGTIAGVEDMIPVRYNSRYFQILYRFSQVRRVSLGHGTVYGPYQRYDYVLYRGRRELGCKRTVLSGSWQRFRL